MPLAPNRELVVYALGALGGDVRRIHTEDIAIKCHEMFPASFSWTKHVNLPDKDIVRVALTDARKPQWGALVEGRSGERHGHASKTKREPAPDGWMLTSNGILWLSANGQRMDSQSHTNSLAAHRQKVRKQVAKLRRTPLFNSYCGEPNAFVPAIGEVADFLRCRVDATDSIWNARFEAQIKQAILVDDTTVVDFLTKCRDAVGGQR